MLSLDVENASLNPAAVRAIKNARLSLLKQQLGAYFGFTTATELANYFLLSQVIGESRAREAGNTTRDNRPANLSEGVRAAIGDLNPRVDPALAEVFRILLDPGQGARKMLDVTDSTNSILYDLIGLMINSKNTNKNIQQSLHNIARCIKLHCCTAGTSTGRDSILASEGPNRVLFDTLDSALPIVLPQSEQLTQSEREEQDIKKRIAVAQLVHPLLIPGEKNAELLTVFFNAMPALEMTRATPVMNVKFYSSTTAFVDNKLSGLTLHKFLEGARDIGPPTADNLPLRAIALASQISTGSVPGEEGNMLRTSPNLIVAGMELFTSPQTLVNIEAAKQTQNYLAPIIDPMRPVASIKSFSYEIQSAFGFQGTRTATLELVLHDRSRMGEFADILRPDRIAQSFLEIEFGWSHPDPVRNTNDPNQNPYADLLNLTRITEHFNVVTTNFNFDDVGQVNVTLNLIARGVSETTELSIVGEEAAGNMQQQIRHIRELSNTVSRLSELVYPPPRESESGRTSRRAEFRGAQGLSAAGDATNNLILTKEVLDSMRVLQNSLNSRTSAANPTTRQNAVLLKDAITKLVGDVTNRNATPAAGSALNNVSRTINQEIRQILNKLNNGPRDPTKDNCYNDSFLQTIVPEWWNQIKNNIGNNHPVNPAERTSNTQVPSTGNNGASANPARNATNVQALDSYNDKTKVMSLGTLITAFVAKPLAQLKNPNNSPKFEEVQVCFYNFNNKASIMSHCNISQFPVQMDYFVREYGRLRMESLSRTVNMSVSDFMTFIASKIVDDPLNPAYGINDLYKYEKNGELTQEHPNTFENVMYNKMRIANIGGHPDFVMPQVTFEIEALPVVDGSTTSDVSTKGRTILKIHVFDKACSPNDSFRELLNVGTSDVMGALSAYPGDDTQRQAFETTAGENSQSVHVLRENWRTLQSRMVEECTRRGLIASAPDLIDGNNRIPQYQFVGSSQKLKEYVMKGIPHIIYGAMGTTVKSANVGSMSDPSANTINIQRSFSATPILPNGEQPGGVPLSVYPVDMSITTYGCPLIRYGQEIFVDYNTNTSIDNIYYVCGITHKIESGTFETNFKMIANDGFGQYRNLIGQLNTAAVSISHALSGSR